MPLVSLDMLDCMHDLVYIRSCIHMHERALAGCWLHIYVHSYARHSQDDVYDDEEEEGGNHHSFEPFDVCRSVHTRPLERCSIICTHTYIRACGRVHAYALSCNERSIRCIYMYVYIYACVI